MTWKPFNAAGITITMPGVSGNVTKVSWTGMGCKEIDITTADSVDQWMEFIATMKDPGEIKVTAMFNPGNAPTIGGDPTTISIGYPGGNGTWSCNGFCKGFDHEGDLSKPFEATITCKLTGRPTFGSGGGGS